MQSNKVINRINYYIYIFNLKKNQDKSLKIKTNN